jgi:hypothetical protein
MTHPASPGLSKNYQQRLSLLDEHGNREADYVIRRSSTGNIRQAAAAKAAATATAASA